MMTVAPREQRYWWLPIKASHPQTPPPAGVRARRAVSPAPNREPKWSLGSSARFTICFLYELPQRRSATCQSGDKSPHSTRRRSVKISGSYLA
jgi:hypothetical protein